MCRMWRRQGLAAERSCPFVCKSFRPARLSGCYVYRISFTSRSLPHLCPGPADPARGGGGGGARPRAPGPRRKAYYERMGFAFGATPSPGHKNLNKRPACY